MEEVRAFLSGLTSIPLASKIGKNKRITLSKAAPLNGVVYRGGYLINPEDSATATVFVGFIVAKEAADFEINGVKLSSIPFILKLYPSNTFNRKSIKRLIDTVKTIVSDITDRDAQEIIRRSIIINEFIYIWDVEADARRQLDKPQYKLAIEIQTALRRDSVNWDKFLTKIQKVCPLDLEYALHKLKYPYKDYDLYNSLKDNYKLFIKAPAISLDSVTVTLTPTSGTALVNDTVAFKTDKEYAMYVLHLLNVLYITYKYLKIVHDDLHLGNVLINANADPNKEFRVRIGSHPIIKYKTKYVSTLIDFRHPTNVLRITRGAKKEIDSDTFMACVYELFYLIENLQTRFPRQETSTWLRARSVEFLYDIRVEKKKNAPNTLDQLFYPIIHGLIYKM